MMYNKNVAKLIYEAIGQVKIKFFFTCRTLFLNKDKDVQQKCCKTNTFDKAISQIKIKLLIHMLHSVPNKIAGFHVQPCSKI